MVSAASFSTPLFSTLAPLTLRLAEAIGLYAIALGLSGLLAPARWRAIADDLASSPGLVLAFGVAAFAIGVAVLIPHHLTSDPLALAVTLLAWLTLAEGVVLVAFPDPLIRLARPLLLASRVWGLVALIAGIVLFLAGLTGRADAIS